MLGTRTEKHELQNAIERLYDKHKTMGEGELATYIPELEKADPEDFGICLVTSDGQIYETGQSDVAFTIQSISKPFTFGMALQELGHEKVLR
jgi:glutaminase